MTSRILERGDFSHDTAYEFYKKQIQELVDAVEGKIEDITDIEDGIKALAEYYKNPENVIDMGLDGTHIVDEPSFDLDDDAEPRLEDQK